jgi:hypothetical protein
MPGTLALVEALRARGHKVLVGEPGNWASPTQQDWEVLLLLGPQEIALDNLEGRRVIFADTVENHRSGSRWPDSLPYATPVDLEQASGSWRQKASSSTISVLVCDPRIEEAFTSQTLRASIDCASHELFEDVAQFRKRVQGHDVVVLDLDKPAYTSWAVEALACGATVLAPHHQPQAAHWAPIKHSPVISVTPESLFLKLDKICREPRCVSDLSRRALRFVEEYHDARKIAALFESWIQAEEVKRTALQVRAKDMACDLLG